MYESQVTVVGRLATDVSGRRLNNGSTVANFRVASTERRFDQVRGAWGDGDTLYIDVRCWRELAQNAIGSLRKGDPVVVTGRLFTREYEHEGRQRAAITIEARSVAADLNWCTVVLTRTRRRADGSPDDDAGSVAGAVPARAAGGDASGPADHASTTSGPQGDRSPEGSRPQLVSVAPGDEG